MSKIDSTNYVEHAIRTESHQFNIDEERIRLLHGGTGLATESAEFLDKLRKPIFYNKPLDKIKLADELGDILWFAALCCSALGMSLEDIMTANIDKLKARYPEKFTTEAFLNRDLDKEFKAVQDVVG